MQCPRAKVATQKRAEAILQNARAMFNNKQQVTRLIPP
jgi:hypothetical protein